jgi:hypothetical protein
MKMFQTTGKAVLFSSGDTILDSLCDLRFEKMDKVTTVRRQGRKTG